MENVKRFEREAGVSLDEVNRRNVVSLFIRELKQIRRREFNAAYNKNATRILKNYGLIEVSRSKGIILTQRGREAIKAVAKNVEEAVPLIESGLNKRLRRSIALQKEKNLGHGELKSGPSGI